MHEQVTVSKFMLWPDTSNTAMLLDNMIDTLDDQLTYSTHFKTTVMVSIAKYKLYIKYQPKINIPRLKAILKDYLMCVF